MTATDEGRRAPGPGAGRGIPTGSALTASLASDLPAAGLPGALTGERMDLDPHDAGRDLACLVLTIVELLRQLMERQAIRRLDQGDLDPAQEERLGTALMLLDQRMTEMCETHGLRREDLGLDLGPLGTLLADDAW